MDSSIKNNRSNILCKNEVSSRKNHLISGINSFEVTINDKRKKYFDKVQSLLLAWEQLTVFVSDPNSESPQPEFESLFLHTLRFVLRPDWPRASVATQTHLTVTLHRFMTISSNSKKYPSILQQCRVLESVVKNPWSHPVLSKIFADEEVDFFDLLDYFQFENGKVIVIRLEMMLEAQCEDMALLLSKSCLQTYYNSEPMELDFNQIEIDYVTDIYFCCLYKNKKKKDLTTEIKLYDLDEGLHLLKRYNKSGGVGKGFNDNCRDVRVWKCSEKVVDLVANTLLANAVMHDDLIDSDTILPDLISEWAIQYRPTADDELSPIALEIIRKLVLIAGSSKCIYPFCSFLIENYDCKNLHMNYVARCLIRAINQNMNEIEQYRVNCDYEKLRVTYEQLSEGFVLISKLFSGYHNIYKECLLTSFSLTPSRECLKKLEAFMEKTLSETDGDNTVVDESRKGSSSDQVVPNSEEHSTDTVQALDEPKTGELSEILENIENVKNDASNAETDVDKKSNTSIEENAKEVAPAYCAELENLKLEESVKIDMDSVLRYQRFRTLSWELEWSELKTNCEKFLELFEERGFDEVELKYLDLDYNQFKDVPINYEEYIGIEKGYEQYAVEYNWVGSENEANNRRSTHSSADTDRDEDDKAKKRKKSFSRSKIKKKRLKYKTKTKSNYDESEWEDMMEFDDNSKDTSLAMKKKRKSSIDSTDGEMKVTKKKRGRKLKAEKSDTNVDSQSENKPPDDMNALSSSEVEVHNSSSLQLLRQFRINMKPLSMDEFTESESNDADLKHKENVAIESRDHILKIRVPKFNEDIDENSDVKFDNENRDADVLTINNDLVNKVGSKKERKMKEKHPRPRSSVTLQIDRKQKKLNKKLIKARYRNRIEDFSTRCEVRLPKNSEIDGLSLGDTVLSESNKDLDEALHSLVDLWETGNIPENDTNQDQGILPSGEAESQFPCINNETNESSSAISDVTEDVIEINVELPSQMPSVVVKKKRKKHVDPSVPRRPRGRPRKCPVEMTNVDQAFNSKSNFEDHSFSSVIAMSSCDNAEVDADGQFGVPQIFETSKLVVENEKLDVNLQSSPSPEKSLNSYLSKSYLMQSPSISSYTPTVSSPMTIPHRSDMPTNFSNNELVTPSMSPKSNNMDFSHNWNPYYTTLSITKLQSDSEPIAPSQTSPTCSNLQTISNVSHHGVEKTHLSNNESASTPKKKRIPKVNDAISPSNKLREALERPFIDSMNGTTSKKSKDEGNIEAVHQILGKYSEIVHKFPEIQCDQVMRKRTTMNGEKKPRKSKKNTVVPSTDSCSEIQYPAHTALNTQLTFNDNFTSPVNGVKRNRPRKKSAKSSSVPVPLSDSSGQFVEFSNASVMPSPENHFSNQSYNSSTSQSPVQRQQFTDQQQYMGMCDTYNVACKVQIPYENGQSMQVQTGGRVENVQLYNGFSEAYNNGQTGAACNKQEKIASSQEYQVSLPYQMNSQPNNFNAYEQMNVVQPQTIVANSNGATMAVANVYYENYSTQPNSIKVELKPNVNGICNSGNVMQNSMNMNGNIDPGTNVKFQLPENVLNDPAGVCISIPEDSYQDSYFSSYLALIENTTSISYPQPCEQNRSSNVGVNYGNELISPYLYSDEIPSYGSL